MADAQQKIGVYICLMTINKQINAANTSKGPMPNVSPLKRTVIQTVASGISTIVDAMLMLPLDVVKTRLQLQTRSVEIGDSTRYASVSDAFVKIYRQEGMPAFWRGLGPLLVADIPKRTIKFVVFENAKPYLLFGASQPTALTYALAGGLGGSAEVLLVNPFEVVKVTQQANRKKKQDPVRVARKIIDEGGFGQRGLYKGVTTTIMRNFIFHNACFGFFFSVREGMPASNDATTEFIRNFVIAFTAGTLGCVFSIPLDVAKTRIQGPQPVPGEIKYARTWRTVCTVYQEEGWRALYRGLLPQIMRVGPGGAILLLGYEFVTGVLFNYFT